MRAKPAKLMPLRWKLLGAFAVPSSPSAKSPAVLRTSDPLSIASDVPPLLLGLLLLLPVHSTLSKRHHPTSAAQLLPPRKQSLGFGREILHQGSRMHAVASRSRPRLSTLAQRGAATSKNRWWLLMMSTRRNAAPDPQRLLSRNLVLELLFATQRPQPRLPSLGPPRKDAAVTRHRHPTPSALLMPMARTSLPSLPISKKATRIENTLSSVFRV